MICRAYTIKKPEMMDKMNMARYNPNVIMTIVIAIAVYIAYIAASSIILMAYMLIYTAQNPDVLRGTLTDIFNHIMQLMLSQDMILFSLYLMLLLILLIIIEVRFIEKRPLSTIGLSRERFALKYLKGFGIGTLLVLVYILPMTDWNEIVYTGVKPAAILFLLAFVIQTASEEILFRGYLLTSFGHKIGMFRAVMLSSFVFALLHILNGDMTLFSIVTIFLIGVFLGFYMIRTDHIWGAFGIHAAWNFIQGCFSGIDIGPVSFDYSFISIAGADDGQKGGIIGDPSLLIAIAIFLIAIACVLFVGKNKIVKKNDFRIDEKTV